MWYIIVFVFTIAGLLLAFTGMTSCSGTAADKVISPGDSLKKNYTREEVNELLKALAERPVKAELNMGAMCYAPRQAPDSASYICPVCGEKTIYVNSSTTEFINDDLMLCRQLAARFDKGMLSLDESGFCAHCSHATNANPELCVKITLEDSKEVITCKITSFDLRILLAFFKGENIFTTFNDAEMPLKEQSTRLKQLLGVTE
jgi:hypothetical protein